MAVWALIGYALAVALAASLVAFSLTEVEAFAWSSLVLFAAVAIVREIAREK